MLTKPITSCIDYCFGVHWLSYIQVQIQLLHTIINTSFVRVKLILMFYSVGVTEWRTVRLLRCLQADIGGWQFDNSWAKAKYRDISHNSTSADKVKLYTSTNTYRRTYNNSIQTRTISYSGNKGGLLLSKLCSVWTVYGKICNQVFFW